MPPMNERLGCAVTLAVRVGLAWEILEGPELNDVVELAEVEGLFTVCAASVG